MQMQHRHLNFGKQSTNISEAKQYNCQRDGCNPGQQGVEDEKQ
jgi:hypothetical protein